MLVCRWWDFESARLLPVFRRGDKLDGCNCRSEAVAPLLAGEICADEGSDREFVAKGFTAAFHTSMSIDEAEVAATGVLSIGRSARKARGNVS
jgi:hypothetical protein